MSIAVTACGSKSRVGADAAVALKRLVEYDDREPATAFGLGRATADSAGTASVESDRDAGARSTGAAPRLRILEVACNMLGIDEEESHADRVDCVGCRISNYSGCRIALVLISLQQNQGYAV